MSWGVTAIAVVCALLSGAGFYFSVVPTELWPLAWLTPVPVLWLAVGKTNSWAVFVAS
jgi:apolipoprotein N-acyltransferase